MIFIWQGSSEPQIQYLVIISRWIQGRESQSFGFGLTSTIVNNFRPRHKKQNKQFTSRYPRLKQWSWFFVNPLTFDANSDIFVKN